MRTYLVAAALFAPACGVETDDRPATAEYIAAAITRPSCATAACHSSATAREGYILDTVEGLCDTTTGRGAGGIYGTLVDGAAKRMPLDSPLPQADIDLIFLWESPLRDPDFPMSPEGCPPL